MRHAAYPVDTGHTLNVHKTFRRRLIYVQFTFCVYGVMFKCCGSPDKWHDKEARCLTLAEEEILKDRDKDVDDDKNDDE